MKAGRFFGSVLIGIPIGITLMDKIGYIAKVDGISMQPTLNPDVEHPDYVFLNRYAASNIERGEIVAVISPKNPNETLIKRVVGLSGDIVCSHKHSTEFVQIPRGHCWVEGDHRAYSMDSNSFGPISLGLITAKATYIVWPPSRWQTLPPSMLNHNVAIKTAKVSAG